MQINFTTTAMCRPDIFRQTLESFSTNLRDVNFKEQTLFLNVDRMPKGIPIVEVYNVAHQYFRLVRFRTPYDPSFPAAVKWCWSQPTTEFFFHLEDDWIMDRPFSILDLLEPFKTRPNLACVGLRAYSCNPMDDRINLSPCVMRTAHAKIMAARMTLDANPERQLRAKTEEDPWGGKQEGFVGFRLPRDAIIIRDIGRSWLERSGMRKNRAYQFTAWV